MDKHDLKLVGTADPRVDGIDVAQLLRDIGEASASTSPVDLFGLCVRAQRVLAQVGTGTTNITAPDEAELLPLFRALNGQGRDYVIGMAKQLQAPFPRRHATLTLVPASLSRGSR